jgi:hypothetical protein
VSHREFLTFASAFNNDCDWNWCEFFFLLLLIVCMSLGIERSHARDSPDNTNLHFFLSWFFSVWFCSTAYLNKSFFAWWCSMLFLSVFGVFCVFVRHYVLLCCLVDGWRCVGEIIMWLCWVQGWRTLMSCFSSLCEGELWENK